MIHQQIKELFFFFFFLWNTLFLIFHSMLSIPIRISGGTKKSLPRSLFPFSFHKAHHPPGLKCLISVDWILPCQPLLPSASSGQSLNPRRWRLYSAILIPRSWNCRPLPLRIRITVSLLPMAQPALFSALWLSHQQTTTVARATLPTVSTACI